MRHLLRVVLICGGVILIARGAAAQSPWYISGGAGVFLRSDASRSTTISNASGATGPGTNTATFNPGPVIDIAVGYKLPLGFRVEGELGFAHDGISSGYPRSTNGTFPNLVGNRLLLQSGGNQDEYSATVDMFYDFPISGPVVPYAGVGAGVVYDVSQTGVFAGPGVSKFTSRGSSLAYPVILAEVGLTVAVAPQWAIVPSYRYEHGFGSGMDFPINANIFQLRLRYSF